MRRTGTCVRAVVHFPTMSMMASCRRDRVRNDLALLSSTAADRVTPDDQTFRTPPAAATRRQLGVVTMLKTAPSLLQEVCKRWHAKRRCCDSHARRFGRVRRFLPSKTVVRRIGAVGLCSRPNGRPQPKGKGKGVACTALGAPLARLQADLVAAIGVFQTVGVVSKRYHSRDRRLHHRREIHQT